MKYLVAVGLWVLIAFPLALLFGKIAAYGKPDRRVLSFPKQCDWSRRPGCK